ncbi:MAG TPA: amidase [Magnetospirillaceae bacterium]|jgi:aspartyl-tRNA(Asn)/glutamyl-tRNA(Gln) amidotransferase subunit A
MSSVENYESLGAAEIARRVRSGCLSPVDVAESALARLDLHNPTLNAFCTPTPELARQTAQALAQRIARGETVGPLAGVPVAIKDLVLTKGIRTTFGSKLYADYIPTEDDIVVERLRAADAIILGKTNASEFGYGGFGHNPLFPTTRNPWNTDLTPGGSSAGSAAAVAAGICPIAVASDGGGSIRLPASFSGLVGVKASMGRVPLWPGCRDETLPGVSGWESIEHIGPLARSVLDAALMLETIAGPDPRDRLSLPNEGVGWTAAARSQGKLGLRVAYCPEWGGVPVDSRVRAIIDAAVAKFERDLGCTVSLEPAPIGDFIECFRAVVALETDLAGFRRLATGREEDLSPSVQNLLAKSWSSDAFTDAVTQRKAAVNSVARFMQRFDLILTPTVPIPAFAIDRAGPGTIAGMAVADDAWTPALYPANFTGQPAASVPAGWTEDGLPVGLQIMGRHLADHTVISAAAAFEACAPWSDRRPT